MGATEESGLCALYAITPDWNDSRRLLVATDGILQAGCRWLQYRNKTATRLLRLAQAEALRELTQRHGARLIVNDDLELALSVEADGLHLGRDDGDLAAAREALGAGRLLGASCYQSPERARLAVAAGADYVAFGSVYPSATKPQAERVSLRLLAEVARALPVPVAAIGGITPDNAPAVLDTGVRLLAVINALYDAPDPRRAAVQFMALFATGKDQHDLSQ